MKVEVITGKYKPENADGWVKRGEQVELPDAEATAAIDNGAAKAIGESSPQPPAPAEPAYAEPRRGRPAKEE
jgi:hypothetical protein